MNVTCTQPVFLDTDKFNLATKAYKMAVPCNKCLFCLRRRSKAWGFRLENELNNSESAVFLTMTYADSEIPYSRNGLQTLKIRDTQLFMKRIRKQNEFYQSPLKYYTIGEYGTKTDRPHFHSILFNLPEYLISPSYDEEKNIQHYPELQELWGKGHVHLQTLNGARINYVTGYLHKNIRQGIRDFNDDRQREKSIMSKGLGENYLTEEMKLYYQENMISYATKLGGIKTGLPRYYKDKIYSEEQMQIIARENEYRLIGIDPMENFQSPKHYCNYIEKTINHDRKKQIEKRSQI